jgi:hypothetical protein
MAHPWSWRWRVLEKGYVRIPRKGRQGLPVVDILENDEKVFQAQKTSFNELVEKLRKELK